MNASLLLTLATRIDDELKKHLSASPPRIETELQIQPHVKFLSYNEGSVGMHYGMRYVEKQHWHVGDRYRFIQETAKQLPEFRTCSTAIEKLYGLSSPDTEGKLTAFVERFIDILVGTNGTVQLVDYVSAFIRDLDNAPLLWSVEADLVGVFLPEEAPLAHRDFSLRRPTKEDFEVPRPVPLPDDDHFELPAAYLSFTVRTTEQGEMRARLDRILDLLRLFNLGSVTSLRLRAKTDSVCRPGYHSWSNNRFTPPFKYGLKADYIQDFDHFAVLYDEPLAQLIRSGVAHSARERLLSTAFQRYKDALLGQLTFEERITRAVTCLEALFLKGTERFELSHKLSQRVSYLLRGYGLRPLEVYQNLQAAYEIRSSYVHGSEVSAEDKQRAENLPRKILEYCRVSLLVFLQLKKELSKDNFIGKIDNALLDTAASEKFAQFVSTLAKPRFINLK